MSNSVLFAYGFDGLGGAAPLEGKAIAQALEHEDLAWVHLDTNHPDTRDWVNQELAYLDPHITDALTAEETRPRASRIGDGLLLILRGVNLNENADPEDMVSLRMWIDPHRIITLRRRKVRAVLDIEAELKDGHGPKNSSDFLAELVTRLCARMQPVLSALDDETDRVEEDMLADADSKLREDIVHIRMQAITFRRHMAPQRDVIHQLLGDAPSWLDKPGKRALQENYHHIVRYVEDLEAIRDRAQIVKDELANIIADRLNRNMYVLSVVAAIFLPLGFLTGLLGINVGGIPGSDNTDAFAIFCAILCAVVLAQVLLFRKMRWF
jgi:zinc transporter